MPWPYLAIDSVFASASINLTTNAHIWGATHVVCDMQFVTLGTSTLPAHAGKLYAIGLGRGFFVLDPTNIPLVPVADVAFSATGMMQISDDNDAAIVAENSILPPLISGTFTKCALIKLSAIGPPAITYVCGGDNSENDIAVVGTTVYITANNGLNKGMYPLHSGHWRGPGGRACELEHQFQRQDRAQFRQALDAAGGTDTHEVQRIDLSQNVPVIDNTFRIPVQIAPVDIVTGITRNEMYVLNGISSTVSTID